MGEKILVLTRTFVLCHGGLYVRFWGVKHIYVLHIKM